MKSTKKKKLRMEERKFPFIHLHWGIAPKGNKIFYVLLLFTVNKQKRLKQKSLGLFLSLWHSGPLVSFF